MTLYQFSSLATLILAALLAKIYTNDTFPVFNFTLSLLDISGSNCTVFKFTNYAPTFTLAI